MSEGTLLLAGYGTLFGAPERSGFKGFNVSESSLHRARICPVVIKSLCSLRQTLRQSWVCLLSALVRCPRVQRSGALAPTAVAFSTF